MFKIEADRADLEAIVHAFASRAAAEHGAEVKRTQLELTSRGPRTLDFRATVTAKAFVMTATVAIRGTLEIDDALHARFSGLACSGEGAMGSMAAGFLRSPLDRLAARAWPLAAWLPSPLRLHDVCVSAGDTVRITAELSA